MIELDGSKYEGGGQIVRTALALSTITQRPFRIFNIRKGRDKPGLKAQHIACIKALKQLCDAETKGDILGSEELIYHPNPIVTKNIDIDIGTAGSITLLLQSILLPIIFSKKTITVSITGGTCGLGQMPVEYFKAVLLPHLKKYVKDIKFDLIKRGYYPKGKGIVELKVKPKFKIMDNYDEFIEKYKEEFIPINLTKPGHLIQIKGISHASMDLMKSRVAERTAKAARMTLNDIDTNIHIREEYQNTLSTGTGITLYAIRSLEHDERDFNNPIILGSDKIGKKGVKAEIIGHKCAIELISTIKNNCPVDKFLADNLIPFLAIFSGKIKTEYITDHTKANIWVCQEFLNSNFKIKDGVIEVESK